MRYMMTHQITEGKNQWLIWDTALPFAESCVKVFVVEQEAKNYLDWVNERWQ